MNILQRAWKTVKEKLFTRSVNLELDCLDSYKRTQCFVHTDLIDWFKKDLERTAKYFKVTKIIIQENNDPHGNGMGIMKCLDVYWTGSDIVKWHISGLCESAKYRMLWKNDLTYYTRSELKDLFMLELGKCELLKFVIHEDNVSVVNWWGNTPVNTNLIVITLNNIINIEQLLKLNEIFSTDVFTAPDQPALFMLNEVFAFFTTEKLYHNINFLVLTAFRGQFLEYLSLEDLLSLELANKNVSTWYDNALNLDIQKHLKDRLPQMYRKRKFDEYYANEFAKSTILSYFMYKYGDRFKTVYIPDQMLSKAEKTLHSVLHGLTIKILEGVVLYLSVVSREGYPICTIKFIASPFIRKVHEQKNFAIRHQELCIDEFDKITSIASSFKYMNPLWCYIIKLNVSNINANSANFDQVLRKLLEIWFSRTITFKISYNGHHVSNAISRCMSSAWVDFATNFATSLTSDSLEFMPTKKYTLEFNQTTLYVQNFFKFLNKLKVNNPNSCVDSNTISLIECRIKISTKLINLIRKSVTIPSDLVICLVHFVKMSIDLRVVLLILNKTSANIALDNCHIIPSNIVFSNCSFSERPRSFKFKNMTIGKQMWLQIISTIATDSSTQFSNCTIEWDDQPNSFNSEKGYGASFKDMDLELSTLLELLDIFEQICIENCQILSTNPFHSNHNKCTKCKTINFFDMNIELEIANAILHQLNEFSKPYFNSARFINSNVLSLPSFPLKLQTIHFKFMNYEDHLTPEILTLLTSLNNGCEPKFENCRMSNQMYLDIFKSCLTNNIVMRYTNFGQEAKDLNDFVYFDLVLEFYNHHHNLINYEMEMDLKIPYSILPRLHDSYIRFDWQTMKLRSVPINSGITVKLVFLENGMYPIDLFFEKNNLTYDSNICEVDYY